jgi:DNA-binding GntR family transcriptional regulator
VGVKQATTKDGIAGTRCVDQLKRLVLSGELGPGEQIRQEQIAERLNVSRPLVREALRALTTQGLLEHRPHQGFFVTKRAPIELAQIMLMLDLLEPQLMRSMTPPAHDVIARLNELNQRMGDIADDWDNTETLALNREFHFLLFGQSPYRLVYEEVERLWGLAEPFLSQKLASPDSRRQAVHEHEQILTALDAGDIMTAADAHDAHRTSGRHGVLPQLPTTN